MPRSAISLDLEPGQKATLQPVTWQGFEKFFSKLGERRLTEEAVL